MACYHRLETLHQWYHWRTALATWSKSKQPNKTSKKQTFSDGFGAYARLYDSITSASVSQWILEDFSPTFHRSILLENDAFINNNKKIFSSQVFLLSWWHSAARLQVFPARSWLSSYLLSATHSRDTRTMNEYENCLEKWTIISTTMTRCSFLSTSQFVLQTHSRVVVTVFRWQ